MRNNNTILKFSVKPLNPFTCKFEIKCKQEGISKGLMGVQTYDHLLLGIQTAQAVMSCFLSNWIMKIKK